LFASNGKTGVNNEAFTHFSKVGDIYSLEIEPFQWLLAKNKLDLY